MRPRALTALIITLATASAAFAQSIVFVSPSIEGRVSVACSSGSHGSFEEAHYLAVVHDLAGHLCTSARVETGIGLWRGQAETSGLIDGCSKNPARELGALLGMYYHQKAALIFTRDASGPDALISFYVRQPLAAISAAMTHFRVSGATVVPGGRETTVMIVANTTAQYTLARRLCGWLNGQTFHSEPGTAELLGNDDRGQAKRIYDGVLSSSPAEVRQLREEMYTERFSDLGLETGPTQ